MATTAAAIHTIYLEESSTPKERLKDPLSEPKKSSMATSCNYYYHSKLAANARIPAYSSSSSPHSSLSQRAFWGPNPEQSREVELVAKLKCAVEWNGMEGRQAVGTMAQLCPLLQINGLYRFCDTCS